MPVCELCWEDIEPGDQIAHKGEDLVHARCLDSEESRGRGGRV